MPKKAYGVKYLMTVTMVQHTETGQTAYSTDYTVIAESLRIALSTLSAKLNEEHSESIRLTGVINKSIKEAEQLVLEIGGCIVRVLSSVEVTATDILNSNKATLLSPAMRNIQLSPFSV